MILRHLDMQSASVQPAQLKSASSSTQVHQVQPEKLGTDDKVGSNAL